MIYKILFSLLLGFIIGIEREHNDKPAGIRTIMLVTLGATLLTIIDLIILNYNFSNSTVIRFDFSRILAYIIVSIGFLGSGVIIVKKGNIEGITTASTLWVAVAIGILVGINKLFLAFLVSFAVFIILESKYIVDKIYKFIKRK